MSGQCKECGDATVARGLCSRHYQAARAAGMPTLRPPTAAQRFWSKVEKSGYCWNWKGCRTPIGYGQFYYAGRVITAHRWSLADARGVALESLDGLDVDHLCRNPSCVNPAHLEAVTHRINCLRGISPVAEQARQTHCKNGHKFDDVNTVIDRKGKRRCRTCRRAWEAERRRRKRAKAVLLEELDRRTWGGGAA